MTGFFAPRALSALLLAPGLMLATAASATDAPRLGDAANGAAIWKASCASCHDSRGNAAKAPSLFDSDRFNAGSAPRWVKMLTRGQRGHKSMGRGATLNAWDALSYVADRNTAIADLKVPGDALFVGKGTFDEYAIERVEEAIKRKLTDGEKVRRVFAFYELGGEGMKRIPNNPQAREVLLPEKQRGFAVVVPLQGFRDGVWEATFVVDKDIRIVDVVVRDQNGDAPRDVNRAARRFIGKGGRGKYAKLRPAGADRVAKRLAKPLTDAFLLGMEAVYMFERDEKERFEF